MIKRGDIVAFIAADDSKVVDITTHYFDQKGANLGIVDSRTCIFTRRRSEFYRDGEHMPDGTLVVIDDQMREVCEQELALPRAPAALEYLQEGRPFGTATI